MHFKLRQAAKKKAKYLQANKVLAWAVEIDYHLNPTSSAGISQYLEWVEKLGGTLQSKGEMAAD